MAILFAVVTLEEKRLLRLDERVISEPSFGPAHDLLCELRQNLPPGMAAVCVYVNTSVQNVLNIEED